MVSRVNFRVFSTFTSPAAGEVTIRFRGRTFTAVSVAVNRKDLKTLGINPALFRDGLKILFLDQRNYSGFCRSAGIGEGIEGFYPLARRDQVAAVQLGAADYLPPDSRRIVLPAESADRRTIAHEVLHDIYMGGGISRQLRDVFTRHLFIWAYKAQRKPARWDEARFYVTIAEHCNRAYNLNISGDDVVKILGGKKLDEKSHAYIGECFAYAGELLLGYTKESEVGKLPSEIEQFLRKAVRLKA